MKRCATVVLMAALVAGPAVALAEGEAGSAPSTAAASALIVESDPPAADLYVDGRLAGHTPLRVSGLTPGDHRVRIVKDGYLENGRVVSVGATARILRVKLTPRPESRNTESAMQQGGGGSAGGSKRALIAALAGGGGAVGTYFLLKKHGGAAPTVGSVSFSPPDGIIVATDVTFAAIGAADPEGDTLSFRWDFGDGATAAGATPTHAYASAGTFVVKVIVSDGDNSASATANLAVRNLTATWTSTYPTIRGLVIDTNLTQSGTNLTGSWTVGSASGTALGSVNATTRLVTIAYTCTAVCAVAFTFAGTANAAVTTLTGTTADTSGGTIFSGGAITVMTRP